MWVVENNMPESSNLTEIQSSRSQRPKFPICDKDYPSCLCVPNIDKAIEIYLSCIEEKLEELKWLNLV